MTRTNVLKEEHAVGKVFCDFLPQYRCESPSDLVSFLNICIHPKSQSSRNLGFRLRCPTLPFLFRFPHRYIPYEAPVAKMAPECTRPPDRSGQEMPLVEKKPVDDII